MGPRFFVVRLNVVIPPIVPCRTGNHTQNVSCRYVYQWCNDEQETIRK